jgi:hypothetical protein
MKIGILGSGTVGRQLGLGFIKSGHEVRIGSRNPEKLKDWQQQAGAKGSLGSVADAASFGEIIVLATHWENDATKNAIEMADRKNFAAKIVIDVTNPLDFSVKGAPPKLAVAYPHSGGLIIQGWLPDSKVVKAFNIIGSHYMTSPKLEEGMATMFICGDDKAANDKVAGMAHKWGWEVIDIGGIGESYLLEALAMIWIKYGFLNNYWMHGFRLMMK